MNYKFEPYQEVLVRSSIGDVWRAKFFSNYTEDNQYFCTDDIIWEMCIPYKGNEHLLGTRDDYEEKQKPFEWGEKLIYLKGEPLEGECIFLKASPNLKEHNKCFVSFKDGLTNSCVNIVNISNLSRPDNE